MKSEYCTSTNRSDDSCDAAFTNASECAALGPTCFMKPDCFEIGNRRCRSDSKDNCTATAGCFWSTSLTITPNRTRSYESCAECFSTPSHNIYLRAQELVGQMCNYSADTALSFLSAVPSATGCSGGVPIPLPVLFPGPPFNCSSTSSPSASSSSPPSLSGGVSLVAVFFATSLLA